MEEMHTAEAGHPGWVRLLPVAAAGFVGVAVTAVVVAVPTVRFAYESLELHVALESSQGVIALLLAYLALGRMRLTRQLSDLVLVLAFSAFAATNLFVSALPVALEGETIGLATWTATGLRLVAATSLAAAALVPRQSVPRRGVGIRTAAAALVVGGATLTLAAVADATLAELIDPELSPDASGRPLLAGHEAAAGIQLAGAALMSVAATAFSLKARRTGDELVRWLAAGATLGAFARLNYALFPSLYTEWFYTGDLLRLGSYLLFLVGAAREIGSYWQHQADLAVSEERRRMARELHDGLSQELTFMRSQLMAVGGGELRREMLPFVAAAAERALVESRKVISALTESGDVALAPALRRAAEEVAARSGAVVDVHDSNQLPVTRDTREELERIVREAVTNAVHHGGASSITLRIGGSVSQLIVRVEDDGRGFEPGAAARSGFGLTSMRERAEGLRGALSIESAPGRGCAVEVTVPASSPS